MEPFVSVVTPFYNTAAYLPQCIESVLGQSYRNFEYVLVDNCSTDDSLAIATKYAAADSRIRIVHNSEFLGQVANYNHALRQISPESRYCKMVQADDWIYPQCLVEMVRVGEAHPTAGIVGAFTLLQTVVYLDGLPHSQSFMSGREVCRRFLLDGLYVWGSPTATLLRAALVRARNPFYDEASPTSDVDSCFEVLQHADFGFVHQVLSFTRRDNDSIHSRIRSFNVMMLTEMMAIEKYGSTFLSAEEHARRRTEIRRRYYGTLGEAALRRQPSAFWELHKQGLRVAGQTISPVELATHTVLEALKLVLNPLDTATRAIARYGRQRSVRRTGSAGTPSIPRALGLRAGDLVEVRSEQEILSTLDAQGRLDELPFMPEMLQYCGKQVRVYRRADKTCDTLATYQSRRMMNAVHLENVRCDGTAHSGCQAACLVFWKEAWLKPLTARAARGMSPTPDETESDARRPTRPLTRVELEALTTRPVAAQERVFVCQATELSKATTPLRWWDPRQYVRELRSGNVPLGTMVRALVRSWFNAAYRRIGDRNYPYVPGPLERHTPSRRLGLRPGERVRVRSHEAIRATLNEDRKNRGLSFDVEMTPYCGGEYRVLRRVEQIINDRTGKMIHLPGECIILDGVTCQGCLSRNRLFCPRSIYPYWREIWLERTEVAPVGMTGSQDTGSIPVSTPGVPQLSAP